MQLEVINNSYESVVESFRRIAKNLFTNYKLIVNDQEYRLIDIEFYYYSNRSFQDVYSHKHEHQLNNGKWYSHGSGLDITFGDGENHGGILLRAIIKIDKNAKENQFLGQQIHGPINVKTAIFSELNGVFDDNSDLFYLADVSRDLNGALMPEPNYLVETSRIGLNPIKDETESKKYFNGKFRFVIFPKLGLKNKTQIAKDMQLQYGLSAVKVNEILDSKFL